jgi:hypothetical protein
VREAVALIALAVLAAAVTRWRRAPDWIVAAGCAGLLLAIGVSSGAAVDIWEFVRLGVLTVPLGLLMCTVALWLARHVV